MVFSLFCYKIKKEFIMNKNTKIWFLSLLTMTNVYAAEEHNFYSKLLPNTTSIQALQTVVDDCVNFVGGKNETKRNNLRATIVEEQHATLPAIMLQARPRDLNDSSNDQLFSLLKNHDQTNWFKTNLKKYVDYFKVSGVENFNGFMVFLISPVFFNHTKLEDKNLVNTKLGRNTHISLFATNAGRARANALTDAERQSLFNHLSDNFRRNSYGKLKITFNKISFEVNHMAKGVIAINDR